MNLRRVVFLVLQLSYLAVGCGKDDSPSGPTTSDALPTDPGLPDGAPASATIGASGGSLATDDGLFSLVIPAGALSVNTAISIQPITNTAWGGVGKSYRLTPHGLTFATPIDVVFEIAPEVLSGSSPEFLDVAVQDDQGFWHIFKNRTYDGSAGTLTTQTSHFSDYSTIEGVQIRPGSATVGVTGTVALSVRYCHAETIDGGADDDLVALMYVCDVELAPLGTFSNWSVNGVLGGNSTVGQVVEGPGAHNATYTAPANVPSTNPVAVSVQTTIRGRSALLISNITITNQWSGTATVWKGNNEKAVATLTWEIFATGGGQTFLEPSGTVDYTLPDPEPGCTYRSKGPDSHPLEVGLMVIDSNTNPPTFTWSATTTWQAVWCFQCNQDPEYCEPGMIGADWAGIRGEVTENGTKISGTFLEQGVGYSYEFTRGVPPGP